MEPGAGAGRHRALDQLLLAETLFLTPFLIGFLQTLERTLSAPGPWRPLGSSSAWCSFGEVCHFILTLSEDYDEQPLGTWHHSAHPGMTTLLFSRGLEF